MSDENEYDEPLGLFEGNHKKERPVFSIWQGDKSKDITIMIEGMFLFILDRKSFTRFKNAINIADAKLPLE